MKTRVASELKPALLKRHLWPLIQFKRFIDRRLYVWNQSRINAQRSLRDSLSLTRRIEDPGLTVGTMNSLNRDRWVCKMLAGIPPNSRLLDAGSGEQKYRHHCDHLLYYSQDNAAYDGKGDGRGGHVEGWTYGSTDYICDIVEIPAPSESFDVVLCTEVFEHLPDPLAAVKELTRLLGPGGQLLITAPFCSFTHFSPYFYSTGFSRNWYLQHLAALGFVEVELEPNGNYFEFLAQEIRRLPLMSSSYGLATVPWYARLAVLVILRFLEGCSSSDSGSSEYCCYGWHVKAVKSAAVQQVEL
ncbi:class I SAM-dependent methyltransferase [Cyanobium gracile]|uniref:Methylase involved in ubiquinone/menaquinone biosynthesis n=1 Tax=Cyanobium gracile (strain ATCC 27147 / PCC 6307) TaxID=292564 RepID=K9P7L6_CYAGP|nr:class I SAM-dependent methyltransferase [Cyanobium gracile]AFY29372.1 methylase involved in ubiquinone/menaquinone biosynthesis [Cyanobium gracile PCC 6307]